MIVSNLVCMRAKTKIGLSEKQNPSRSGKSPNLFLSGKTDIIFEEKPGKNGM